MRRQLAPILSSVLSNLRHGGSRLAVWWYGVDQGRYLFLMVLVLVIGGLVYAIHDTIRSQKERQELTCLARNIYHEARGESRSGQLAVAQVTLNRVASNLFPDSVCDVVYEKRWDPRRRRLVGAFSWTELPPGSNLDESAWEDAWEVSKAALAGESDERLNQALFYHARSIRPRWAKQKVFLATIGQHRFYR